CCTRLRRLKVTVELAKQRVLILCRPVGQVVDELFDLLPVSVFKSLRAAEVDGVGLDQDGIKLMLTDQLAEAIAELGFCLPAIPVDGFRGELLRTLQRLSRSGIWSDLFDRTNADPV